MFLPVFLHLSLQVLLLRSCLVILEREVVFYLANIDLEFVGVGSNLRVRTGVAECLRKLRTPLKVEENASILDSNHQTLKELLARGGLLFEGWLR